MANDDLNTSLQLVTIGPEGKVWFAGFGFFGRLNQSRADIYRVPLAVNDMISVGGKVWMTAQRDDGERGGGTGEATVSRSSGPRVGTSVRRYPPNPRLITG